MKITEKNLKDLGFIKEDNPSSGGSTIWKFTTLEFLFQIERNPGNKIKLYINSKFTFHYIDKIEDIFGHIAKTMYQASIIANTDVIKEILNIK